MSLPVARRGEGMSPPVARRRAFLALGSNLGDRPAHLRRAVSGLPDVSAVSPLYETDPVGGPGGQGPFLNAVVELHTRLGPYELLAEARRAEDAARRVRRERFGPRTLDVDVLIVGDEVVDDPPELVVPHPRMWERAFVLCPLADLAPELVAGHPGAAGIIGMALSGGHVRRLGDLVPGGVGATRGGGATGGSGASAGDGVTRGVVATGGSGGGRERCE